MKKALQGDLSEIWYVLLIISVVIVAVILAISIDLYYGKKKSRELGIYKTHSWGLRETSKKATWYVRCIIGFCFYWRCYNYAFVRIFWQGSFLHFYVY